MNCSQCTEMLSEYIDQDLEEAQATLIKQHLANCPSCQSQANAFAKLNTLVQQLPRHQPGTQAILQTSERIHQQEPPPRQTHFGPVMDLTEVAAFLRVDNQTVQSYLGQIPCFELGGKLLFQRKSVEAWIETRELGLGLQLGAGATSNKTAETEIAGGVKWTICETN